MKTPRTQAVASSLMTNIGGGLLQFHAACCRSDVAHCESAEHAPTPQASASPDLVQVARNNTHNLTHLRELPAWLLETVDVGLKTGTAILPVHSYVLVAYSPVSAEILAGDTARPSNLCIPVGDTSTEGLQDALQNIYNRCPLARANVPAITSFAEAARIAAMAHKFDIQLLLEASDAFMSTLLIATYPILQEAASARWDVIKLQTAGTAVAGDMLQWAASAQGMQLLSTLAHCEMWLSQRFLHIPDFYPRFFQLGQDSFVRVLTAIQTHTVI